MPAWPATLPAPLLAGYGVKPDSAVARTDMEAGPARVRRRFTAVPKRVPLACVLDEAQAAAFVTFWESDLADGANWFDLSVNLGSGVVTRSARFLETYSLDMLIGSGDLWKLSGQVEVREF